MSTVDDQIASLLAAAGAADVLERRFASQRDLARNVLRRQTERIARLEQLLATLRERPAPTGSAGAAAAAADAAYPDSAPAWNELTALMRELVRRQEEAERQQQERQEQLLAALAASTSAPRDEEALHTLWAEQFERWREQYEQLAEHNLQRIGEILQQQRSADNASASDASADRQQLLDVQQEQLALLSELRDALHTQQKCQAEREQKLLEQFAALEQLKQQLSERGVQGSSPGDSSHLESLLKTLADQVERQTQAAEQHDGMLRSVLEQLGDYRTLLERTPEGSDAREALNELRQLAEQQQRSEAERKQELERHRAALDELKQQFSEYRTLIESRSEDSTASEMLGELRQHVERQQQSDAEQRAALEQIQKQLADVAADDGENERLAKVLKAFAEHTARQSDAAQQHEIALREVLLQLSEQRTLLESRSADAGSLQVANELRQLASNLEAFREQQAEHERKMADALAKLLPREALATQKDQQELAETLRQLVERQQGFEESQQEELGRHNQRLGEYLAKLEAAQASALERLQGDAPASAGPLAEVQALTEMIQTLATAQHENQQRQAAEIEQLRELVRSVSEQLAREPQADALSEVVEHIEQLRSLVTSATPGTLASGDDDRASALLAEIAQQQQFWQEQNAENQRQLEAIIAQLAEQRPAAVGEESSIQIKQLLEELSERQQEIEARQAEAQREFTRSLTMLQSQLEELSQRLQAPSAASGLGRPAAKKSKPTETTISPSLGWEEAKQRLLAQLESESEDGDASDEPVHYEAFGGESDGEVHGVAAEELAQRDAEIEQLKRELAELRQMNEAASTLDKDELIQQERQRLRLLQEEWQEKLRKAEIDISIERAKLARERTRLEEQLQTLQLDRPEGATDDPNGKAGKNRWLARLGLLEEQNKPER